MITIRLWETTESAPMDVDYSACPLGATAVAQDIVDRGYAAGAVVLMDGVEHTRILSQEVKDQVLSLSGVQL
jgi:hypothetical protein